MLRLENDQEDLTFDDVLLVPQYSEIKSRSDVDVSYTGHLGKLSFPLIASPMDSIISVNMLLTLEKFGVRGILHRFASELSLIKQAEEYFEKCSDKTTFIPSIGISDKDFDFFCKVWADKFNVSCVCIDVASGYTKQMLSRLKDIKKAYPKIKVIAGNVVTPEAIRDLGRAGADLIRVGIGSSGICSTRIVTGHGLAQLTAVSNCAEAAKSLLKWDGIKVEIILDGGIRNSGDAAKGLIFSDLIMVGSILSATDETPGDVEIRNGIKCKKFRGMSSKEINDQLGKIVAPEGISTYKQCKGPVSNVLSELVWGLKSSLTYSGASSLEEFKRKALFRKISTNTFLESKTYGQENL